MSVSVRTTLLATLLLLLAGCASGPGIPETTYFRLPPRTAVEAGEPVLDAPLIVEPFFADGVHAEQALLYALDEDGTRVRAYHYQLWIDPPTRLLQRRLIRTLGEAHVAPLVIERLQTATRQYRLLARLDSFERVPRGDGWLVSVALQVRVDGNDGSAPLLLREYRRTQPAEGSSVRESVRAMGVAVDAIYAELLADLRAMPRG